MADLTTQERMGLIVRCTALARAVLNLALLNDSDLIRLGLSEVAGAFVELDKAAKLGQLGKAE